MQGCGEMAAMRRKRALQSPPPGRADMSRTADTVEKLMVFRVLDHRVNGSCLDFIERHWPELGSELVWLTF